MTQTQLFVSTEIDEILTSPTSQPNPVPAEPNREPVLILVIGSQKGIDKIVSALYLRRFAAVQEWSQILPAPTIGKLMRSLIRYVSLFLDWAKMLFYIRCSALQN
jgi:hypothetical protein